MKDGRRKIIQHEPIIYTIQNQARLNSVAYSCIPQGYDCVKIQVHPLLCDLE